MKTPPTHTHTRTPKVDNIYIEVVSPSCEKLKIYVIKQ